MLAVAAVHAEAFDEGECAAMVLRDPVMRLGMAATCILLDAVALELDIGARAASGASDTKSCDPHTVVAVAADRNLLGVVRAVW